MANTRNWEAQKRIIKALLCEARTVVLKKALLFDVQPENDVPSESQTSVLREQISRMTMFGGSMLLELMELLLQSPAFEAQAITISSSK